MGIARISRMALVATALLAVSGGAAPAAELVAFQEDATPARSS